MFFLARPEFGSWCGRTTSCCSAVTSRRVLRCLDLKPFRHVSMFVFLSTIKANEGKKINGLQLRSDAYWPESQVRSNEDDNERLGHERQWLHEQLKTCSGLNIDTTMNWYRPPPWWRCWAVSLAEDRHNYNHTCVESSNIIYQENRLTSTHSKQQYTLHHA